MRRILKPDGAFAAWCYTIPRIKGNEKATQLIESLLKETLAAYVSPAHKHYFAEYRDIQPTEADFSIACEEVRHWDKFIVSCIDSKAMLQ